MTTDTGLTGLGYSTGELRAAAAALAAGQFAAPTSAPKPPVTIEEQGRSLTGRATAPTTPEPDRGRPRSSTPGCDGAVGSGSLVRVRAANAGAGASTIALALADVADVAGIRTRVLDAADPAWSGLLGATVTELGAAEGWRRGRRGQTC